MCTFNKLVTILKTCHIYVIKFPPPAYECEHQALFLLQGKIVASLQILCIYQHVLTEHGSSMKENKIIIFSLFFSSFNQNLTAEIPLVVNCNVI